MTRLTQSFGMVKAQAIPKLLQLVRSCLPNITLSLTELGYSDGKAARAFPLYQELAASHLTRLNDVTIPRFDRLDFSAPYGAADYITVMLVAPNSVTQYADGIEGRLPPALQQAIEAIE